MGLMRLMEAMAGLVALDQEREEMVVLVAHLGIMCLLLVDLLVQPLVVQLLMVAAVVATVFMALAVMAGQVMLLGLGMPGPQGLVTDRAAEVAAGPIT
jgi:hypothetical protein